MNIWKERAEERLEHLVESIPDGIIFFNNNGRIVFINSIVENIFGLKQSDIIGRAYNDPAWKVTTLDGKPLPEEDHPFVRIMRTGNPLYNFEHIHIRPDGTQVIVSANAAPFHDATGAIAGVILSLTDITKHKTTEKLLKESEERYRYLVELSPDGIAVHSEGKLVYVNNAALKILGAEKPEDLIGKPVLEFVHPDYIEAAKERLKLMQEGKPVSPLEEKFIRLDGESVDVEVAAAPIIYQGKPSVLVVARDITERKKASEEILESRREVLTILESITDGLFAVDADWRLTYVNQKAAELVERKKSSFYLEISGSYSQKQYPLLFIKNLPEQ
ncbi:MAG: PAS domain S-box protein [Firmicutes bacterium]|nr:PAS domain S-box protein [Bacillota bacterium]